MGRRATAPDLSLMAVPSLRAVLLVQQPYRPGLAGLGTAHPGRRSHSGGGSRRACDVHQPAHHGEVADQREQLDPHRLAPELHRLRPGLVAQAMVADEFAWRRCGRAPGRCAGRVATARRRRGRRALAQAPRPPWRAAGACPTRRRWRVRVRRRRSSIRAARRRACPRSATSRPPWQSHATGVAGAAAAGRGRRRRGAGR